ncbi:MULTISPECIES: amidase [unclassified Sphingomonas]|uniref:amidase n=1 Tax=unclassified Sphingomonas TaxID=196159 RepID=UPI000ACA6794|nr:MULTISPECIES: amidase [unclassified Sphingomonas]
MAEAAPSLEQLAADMAAGKRSAEAALDACLARIAAEDHQWKAILSLAPDARDAARRADDSAGRGETFAPLHGIVLAIKDNIDLAGMATTSGCLALALATPRASAPVVERLQAAGAIIIGKTNLSEFSFEVRSRSSLGGDVICPLAPGSTAGGSSGGSAVAVARGYAMAAIGTDTGGSIRIPAACNGLVGLRPAHGVLSLAGVAPLAPSTDTIGPITRSVADAALLYRIMGGTIAQRGARPMRIGMLRQAFGADPAIIAACEQAARRLKEAGVAVIDPVEIAELEALLDGPHIVDAEFAAAFDAYLARNFIAGTAPANLAALLASGRFLPDHRDAITARLAYDRAATAVILDQHRRLTIVLTEALARLRLDALLYPTMRVIPRGLDNPKVGWAPELAARTGWPAMSIPVRGAARPIGVELLVPAGEEQLLFALGRIVESADITASSA